MHSIYLITVVVLLGIGSAAIVRADAPKDINDALHASIPLNDRDIPKYLDVAESLLKSKSNGMGRLFNANTIKLLEQFIKVGKSIQNKDCSGYSRQLIESLPIKRTSDYASWGVAVDVFNEEYDEICSAKLRDLEKELHATLDQTQISKVKQLADISIHIITRLEYFYGSFPTSARAIRFITRNPEYFDELKKDGAAKFSKELIKFLLQEGGQKDLQDRLPEAFDKHASEPCRYYTKATSHIFDQQIERYRDTGAEDEEYNYHFFEYQMCRFMAKEQLQMWKLLQAN